MLLSWKSGFGKSLVVALALALAGCSLTDPVEVRLKPEKNRKLAPQFTLKDANGGNVKFSDFRGKVVLLNFWATWCGPCKIEIPWLIEFQQTYKDRDLVVLGVSFDDDGWTSVKPYVEEKKINYRVMIGTDEMAKLYGGVESLPTTFLVDKQGRIASTHIGLVSKSTYRLEIERLLEAKPETSGTKSQGKERAHHGPNYCGVPHTAC